jgi:hypothetical protein
MSTYSLVRKIIPALVLVSIGCGRTGPTPIPTPTPTPTPFVSALKVFTDSATGFSTTDLRDSQEQILQINEAGQLIFTPSSVAFSGHSVLTGYSGQIYITPPQQSCACLLEIRFGTKDGERRAYLTGEYGHDNPGTLVDIEVTNGILRVRRTDVYPPGSFSLTGVLTEMTEAGPVPVAGAFIYLLVGDGWRDAVADSNGAYSILGLYDGSFHLSIGHPAFEPSETNVQIRGNTRFDAQLKRR